MFTYFYRVKRRTEETNGISSNPYNEALSSELYNNWINPSPPPPPPPHCREWNA